MGVAWANTLTATAVVEFRRAGRMRLPPTPSDPGGDCLEDAGGGRRRPRTAHSEAPFSPARAAQKLGGCRHPPPLTPRLAPGARRKEPGTSGARTAPPGGLSRACSPVPPESNGPRGGRPRGQGAGAGPPRRAEIKAGRRRVRRNLRVLLLISRVCREAGMPAARGRNGA